MSLYVKCSNESSRKHCQCFYEGFPKFVIGGERVSFYRASTILQGIYKALLKAYTPKAFVRTARFRFGVYCPGFGLLGLGYGLQLLGPIIIMVSLRLQCLGSPVCL